MSGKHVQQPGKLLHKDKRRIRRYISIGAEETHVALAQNRRRSSNYYSYNMCHETTDKNKNINNDTNTKSIQTVNTIGRQKPTVYGWMCTNNNETDLTPVHPGRLQAYERRESVFSKHANNCLLYTSPSPRDATLSRMPSSA